MDKLSFLDGDATAETPVAEPIAEGPVRGPDGKFAKAEAETPVAEPAPQPEPEPQPAPVQATPEREPGHVPISALLDERDKRRQLEEQLRHFQQQQAPEPVAPPNPYEDPDGWTDYQQSLVAQSRWDAVTSISQVMANEKHGAELVQSAAQAFMQEVQQRPWLMNELRQQPHPYDWVVKRHQREQVLGNVDPSQFEAFLAWRNAQAATAPVPAPAAPSSLATPPPSINNAASAGGVAHVPVGPGRAYDKLFS